MIPDKSFYIFFVKKSIFLCDIICYTIYENGKYLLYRSKKKGDKHESIEIRLGGNGYHAEKENCVGGRIF